MDGLDSSYTVARRDERVELGVVHLLLCPPANSALY